MLSECLMNHQNARSHPKLGELWSYTEADFRSDIVRSRHPLRRKLGVLMQIAISGLVSRSETNGSTFSGTHRFEFVPRKAIIKKLTTCGSSVHPIQFPKPTALGGHVPKQMCSKIPLQIGSEIPEK